MSDELSRRWFLSGTAVAPALGAAVAKPPMMFDRIAEFLPAPDRVRILVAAATSVVPPPRLSPEELQQIRSAGKNVELTVPANQDELNRLLPEVDVLFGAVNADMLARAKKLRWMQATEAGMEKLLFPELIASPVVITNMARAFAPAISETAIGMLLVLARGFNQYFWPQFQQKKWQLQRVLVEVSGMTMGIVGMGGIGQAVAAKAHYGFDMKVLATDTKPMAKPVFVDTLREPAWLDEMVPQVDVLVSAVPLTKETNKLFNEKLFRSMKKTAYFLNVSRGPVVDSAALVTALKEGWIAGAGIDVADQEPAPPDHPFYSAPNIVLTCHSAGFAPQRQLRLVALLEENVRRYSNGLPLLNVVDKSRGY
jgi:phosphoglycerate dehydrogenase-like enzyme